jgi:stearoyl-CoA desaturase (delta-9 desaturase)
MIEKYGVGTPDDWIERNVYSRYSALGPTLALFTAVALWGAVGLAWWALMMLVIPVFAAGGINGLGHGFGYRNFETSDRSTNLTPWAFLLGGEELHNNHHAFPSSARFAMRRFEFDIGWVVLRLCQRLGLAKILRVAPKLSLRPEVALPDAETVRALLAHRCSVLSNYFREVTKPAFRAETEGKPMARLSGRLSRALSNDGRWLDQAARERLASWINERPLMVAVVEHRRRLAALMERSGKSTDELVNALRDWCRDAEASGIESLRHYAQQLRGYALAPA